jgi:acyl-CoA thioesterase I
MDRKLFIGVLLLLGMIGWSGCRADSTPPGSDKISRTVTAETAGPAESVSPSPDSGRVIVAFGDSLTAGLGVAAEEAYPSVLERTIREAGYSYRVINAGVSGETTAGGLRRVPWILKYRPEIVILELGGNDGLRGLSLIQTKKNLAEIIEALQKAHVRVVLAGMKIPPNYGKEYTEAFEEMYPDFAARYHVTLIPFFLEGVGGRASLNQADGIHPTAEGYLKVVQNVWPKLEPLLGH